MKYHLAASCVIALCVGGCGLLPSGSPTAREFESKAAAPQNDIGFVVVDLDADVARAISVHREPGLTSLGEDTYRSTLRLKVGDVISITIYDQSPVSIFGSNATPVLQTSGQAGGGHISTVPSEVIEQDGRVPIPYGGAVRVSGLTPAAAAANIAAALKGKAANVQVVVSLVNSTLSNAYVNGDVGHPGPVPLTVRGERVLDAVATAGGPKFPVYDTDVQLIRGGRMARANMQSLVVDQSQNIHVRPGDSIVLVHNPKSFAVLGSALKVSQYDFNVERVSLAEALARSGGLNDTLADSGEVYLLRFESADLVRSLLPVNSPQLVSLADDSRPVPVAFHINLHGAAGYFLSQSTQMRDKDLILITNAESVQFSKLLVILKNISGIYYDFAIPQRAVGGAALSATQ